MDDAFSAAVVADDTRFDDRDAALLYAVAENGSLHAATDVLGRSYARAHGRIDELEAAFGPVLTRQRGGPDGGGSRLTDDGRQLLARFDRLRAAVGGTAAAAETVLDGTIETREGELVTVATDAGVLRALAAADDLPDAVQVAVRADAVTLQLPEKTPDDDATSARNRLPGIVDAIDRGETVATVGVDVGGTRPLLALVTTASVDRLDLAVGVDVVASWKATAMRAVGHAPV